MKLSELETKWSEVDKSANDMLDARDASGQEFTADQKIQFKALVAERNSLADSIELEKSAESLRKQKALNRANQDAPETKVAKRYSFIDAIQSQLPGRKLDGLTAEMHQEAEKELRAHGVNTGLEGRGIPSWMVNVKGTNVLGQKRDLTSGGAATGAEWVETMEIGHQFGLEIAPKAFGLGVEVLTGLTGNVYVTQTAQAAAVWESENSSADETTPATSKPVQLSPQRLAAFTDLSKTLMVQTSGVAEQRARIQLQKALNRKLDYTVFQGSGVDPIPAGVTATSSINTFTTGGTPDQLAFLTAWAAIASDDADIDTLKIVTTATIEAAMRGAYLDAGSGRFLMENGKVIGIDTIYSNNCPANTIIMGVWNQFVVGQWGGIDLIANPYTKAKENLIELIINANFDMGCYYPEAFCVATDVTLA